MTERITPERLAELGEYPDGFEALAKRLNPEQLASRIALKDAAAITRELLRELETLTKDRDELKALHDDWKEGYIAVMLEKCPPDEQHCTCVPELRREIERLKEKECYGDIGACACELHTHLDGGGG